MTIVQNEADILHLRNVPWFFGVAIIVFIVAFLGLAWTEFNSSDLGRATAFLGIGVVVGGGGFCLFVRREDIVFESSRGTVEITERSILGTKVRSFALVDVVGSSLERVAAGEGTPRHRIALQISDGEKRKDVPLTRNYFSGSGMPLAKEVIHDWRRLRTH